MRADAAPERRFLIAYVTKPRNAGLLLDGDRAASVLTTRTRLAVGFFDFAVSGRLCLGVFGGGFRAVTEGFRNRERSAAQVAQPGVLEPIRRSR